MAEQGFHGDPGDPEHRHGNVQEGRHGGERPDQVAAGGGTAKLAGPIANARHVPARTRRRRGSSPLLRTALVLALATTLAFGAFRLMTATTATVATAENLIQGPAPVPVASQVSMPG